MKSFYFFFLIFLLPGQGFSSDSESDKKIQYKSYALFFAVNEYESLQNLNNPVRDAHKIAKILSENYDFETEVIENPDLNLMKTTLIRYRDGFINGDLDPKGQLLIYFSGHGKTEYETGFFLPKDTDPTDLYSTGFSYDYWRKFINRLKHASIETSTC
ncbi:MAG: caspase family protein [Bacteroidota bacterium]